MSAAPETYSTGVRCPFCGSLVRVQPTSAQLSKWAAFPPEAVVLTYMCHFQLRRNRQCNTVIEIRASAFQEATDGTCHIDTGVDV